MTHVTVRFANTDLFVGWFKRAKAGKIFLDYLRNDRGSTAVAAWSPRARPGATIFMPVAWDEVTARPSRRLFAILTALGRRASVEPWADLEEQSKPLSRLGPK